MTSEGHDRIHPAILIKMVLESEEYQIYIRFQEMNTNYHVFEKNYQELHKAIWATQHPDALHLLWAQDKQAEMNAVLKEIVRCLHNFLASAKTLIDHTRNMVHKEYKDSDFLEEYESEIQSRFATSDVAQFIEDLRNYTLHYTLPLTSAVFEGERNPETDELETEQLIVLEKDDLFRWRKWSKGLPFLRSAPEDIKLGQLINEYHRQVRSFRLWMRKRLRQIHKEELAWFRKMERRIESAREKGPSGEEMVRMARAMMSSEEE